MSETGRAFDWDDTIEKESPDFTLLPEGTYPFTVRSFERGEYPGGPKLPTCKKAVLTIDIDGGPLGTATVTHNLYLHSRCEGLLCAFFTAIGQRQHGQQFAMNWQLVPGATGMCEIGVRAWTGRDNAEHKNNVITRFLEPTVTPAPAANGWQSGQF